MDAKANHIVHGQLVFENEFTLKNGNRVGPKWKVINAKIPTTLKAPKTGVFEYRDVSLLWECTKCCNNNQQYVDYNKNV